MEFDTGRLISTMIQGSSFVAAFAAITAGVIMSQVTKKFGTGILASGFKSISLGVIFIALGIIIDAITSYLQVGADITVPYIVFLVKELCFVIGTYIIVIGSKKTGDKLEALTKPQVADAAPAPKAEVKPTPPPGPTVVPTAPNSPIA